MDLLEGVNLIQWALISVSPKSGGQITFTIICQIERFSDYPGTTLRPPGWQHIPRYPKKAFAREKRLLSPHSTGFQIARLLLVS